MLAEGIDPANGLLIDLDTGSVNFVADSGASQISVSVENADLYGVNIVSAGGMCRVTTDKNRQTETPPEGGDGPAVTVTVPPVVTGNVDVKLGAGSVALDGLNAARVEVELGVGDVVAGVLTATEVDLETRVGSLEAEAITANKVSLESGVGDIGVLRIDGAQEIEAVTGVGSIGLSVAGRSSDYHFEGSAAGTLEYDGVQSTGGRYEQNKGAAKELEAESGQGDILVSFLSE